VARSFSPAGIFLPLLLIIVFHSSFETAWASGEGSAWIVRDLLLSKDRIDQAILDMRNTGLSRAFIQVSARLHSYFPSEVYPPAEELLSGGDMRDPFGYFTERAKEAGIEVHAWVNILYAWSTEEGPSARGHPFNLHPEWFVHDRGGVSMRYAPLPSLLARDIPGYFLSPAPPEIVELVSRYLEELVRKYDVDGVHLDYIRYPARDTGFGPWERTSFERRYYVDPLELFDPDSSFSLTRRYGQRGKRDLEGKWEEFRAGLITNLIKSLRGRLSLTGKEVVLSAAVLADPDSARTIYGQDWAGWLDQGLVDFVIMMNYTKSTKSFLRHIENPRVRAHSAKVMVGVSTFNQGPEEAVEKARLALERGMRGVCFFSYNDLSMKEEFLPHIKRFLMASK
jgi:uncharacterized lipoprotein YddW (UPF0748 family)